MVCTSTVLEALRRHEPAYRRRYGGDLRRVQVLERLLACRTGALGGHLLVCPDCDIRLPVHKSCDDRHCPQCGSARCAKWLDGRIARILPVPHFQVVFTVPSQLRAVTYDNPKVVYPLMFHAGASVLQDLAEQRMNARLGITSVLHSWASNLTFHPHVHCLVTAGGLRLDNEAWVPTRKNFLFPVKVIARMYRGRLLEGLITAFQAGEVRLRGDDPDQAREAFAAMLRKLSKRYRQWGVHVEAPNDRPVLHALKYLARYIHRVAISDHRMVAVTDAHVLFRARDADGDAKQRTIKLEGAEFVHRFLHHVLPKGFVKVRHFGLYAAGLMGERLGRAHTVLGSELPSTATDDRESNHPATIDDDDEPLTIEEATQRLDALCAALRAQAPKCPKCGGPMVIQPLPGHPSASAPAAAARGPP